MRSDKRVIVVDYFLYNLMLNGLNDFRNKLLEQDKPTEDVDKLLLMILDAPTARERRRAYRDER